MHLRDKFWRMVSPGALSEILKYSSPDTSVAASHRKELYRKEL